MDAVSLGAFPQEASRDTAAPDANFSGFAGLGKMKLGKPSLKGLKSSIKGTGHFVGKVASSKITKGLLAAGLAATGVGVGASAAIMGGVGAGGGLLRKGGGLKAGLRGGAQGAATGAAAGLTGKFARKGIAKFKAGRIAKATPATPSYDSDKRLDALASGGIPGVSLLPSGGTGIRPIEGGVPSVLSLPTIATAGSIEPTIDTAAAGLAAAKRRKENQRIRRAGEVARTLAAGIATAPSANPSAPQGGFPSEVATMSPTDNSDSSVAPKPGISPVMIAAVLGGLLLLTSRKG